LQKHPRICGQQFSVFRQRQTLRVRKSFSKMASAMPLKAAKDRENDRGFCWSNPFCIGLDHAHETTAARFSSHDRSPVERRCADKLIPARDTTRTR
jgi:hypothetical protein